MKEKNEEEKNTIELVNKEIKSKPLNYALNLIEESGISYTDLKKRNLGLQLSLLGLAGVQTKRVSVLLNLVQSLEDYLFDVDVLKNMSAEEKTKLYEVVSRSQRDSIDFVRLVISNTDWDKVEEELSVFQNVEQDKQTVLPEESEIILQQIVKQLNMVKPQIEHKKTMDSNNEQDK